SARPNTQSRPPAMCTTPPMRNRCQGRTAIGSASRPTTLAATWSAGAGVQRRSAPGYPAIVRGHCVDCMAGTYVIVSLPAPRPEILAHQLACPEAQEPVARDDLSDNVIKLH